MSTVEIEGSSASPNFLREPPEVQQLVPEGMKENLGELRQVFEHLAQDSRNDDNVSRAYVLLRTIASHEGWSQDFPEKDHLGMLFIEWERKLEICLGIKPPLHPDSRKRIKRDEYRLFATKLDHILGDA
jgi:hypothetical protein